MPVSERGVDVGVDVEGAAGLRSADDVVEGASAVATGLVGCSRRGAER